MALQSNLWFAAVSPSSVPKPSVGYYALFISDGSNNTAAGFVHKKDSDGDVTTAVNSPDDYTDEMARDAVGSILSDSDTVRILYDDIGNFIAATVLEGSISDHHLVDLGVTTAKIADGAVTEVKLADGSVTGNKIGPSVVVENHIAAAQITNSKLADGAVDTSKLGDSAVTNTKVDSGAITNSKLADNAVGSLKIADAAVTNSKIAPLAVSTGTLADAAVTTTKLAPGAVQTANIVDGSITVGKIADGSVTAAKMAASSVGALNLIDASVTGPKLAASAVGTTSLADGSVTAAKIATDAITNTKMADASVGTAELIDASVTTAKHADASITTLKLADGSVTTTKLGTDSVTQVKLADAAVGTAELIDASVTTAKIATDAITNTKMADLSVGTPELIDASVTSAKLATDAVTQVKIADAAVGTAELVDGSVTAAKLGIDSVTNAKLADAAVGTAELVDGAVTAAKLGIDSVTNVKLADAAVNTAELVDAAVTNPKLATMAPATFKMRAAGAGIGAPIDGTPAQAKTALALTAADISGLGTAATQPSTAFDAAGAATAAQAAAIAASQPKSTELTAIAALTTTAYGRTLLTLANATAETALLDVATASLKGLMSSTDKAKLDGITTSTKTRYIANDNGITPANTGAQNVTAWNTLMSTIPDNSEVFFAPGPNPFPFASTLVIPAGKHLRISGTSNQKSIIQIQSATADIFQVNDWYNEFRGLKFTSSVTRTAGAAINTGNNVAINVYDCDFSGMWDGIVYTGGVNSGNLAVIENCGFTATLNRGIVIDGANANTIIDKVVMDGQSGIQQVGLELLQCGSVLVTNSDLIRSVNNLRLNPTTPNGVFSAYFVNTFFDTSPASSVKFTNTGNIQRVKFTNCWFSGSVTGCEFASTAATLPTAIDFINCDIFGNSSRGVYANGVQDFSISSSRIAGNTTAGIEVNASAGAVTKFNLQNNAITATAGFGANGTAIQVNTGTYGGYVITGNDVRTNTTATIADNGTTATTDLKVVGDNVGHLILGSIGNLAGTASSSSTSATVLLAARVPAKAVNAGQVFRIRLFGISSSTGTLTFRVHAGATGSTGDAQVWQSTTSAAQVTNQRAGFEGLLTVRGAGTTGSVQCEALGYAQTALLPTVVAAVTTPTVNTTVPWYITLAVTCSFGTFTAQQAVVEAL